MILKDIFESIKFELIKLSYLSYNICKVIDYIDYINGLMIDRQDHEVVMNFLLKDYTQ